MIWISPVIAEENSKSNPRFPNNHPNERRVQTQRSRGANFFARSQRACFREETAADGGKCRRRETVDSLVRLRRYPLATTFRKYLLHAHQSSPVLLCAKLRRAV